MFAFEARRLFKFDESRLRSHEVLRPKVEKPDSGPVSSNRKAIALGVLGVLGGLATYMLDQRNETSSGVMPALVLEMPQGVRGANAEPKGMTAVSKGPQDAIPQGVMGRKGGNLQVAQVVPPTPQGGPNGGMIQAPPAPRPSGIRSAADGGGNPEGTLKPDQDVRMVAGNFYPGRGGAPLALDSKATVLMVTPNANGVGMTIKGSQTSLVSTFEGGSNGDAFTALSIGQKFDNGFQFGASAEFLMTQNQAASGRNELSAFHLTATPGVKVGENAAVNLNAMAARVNPSISYKGAQTPFDGLVQRGSQFSAVNNSSVDVAGAGVGARYKGLSFQGNYLSATEHASDQLGVQVPDGSRGIYHTGISLNGYLAGTPFQTEAEGMTFQDGGANLFAGRVNVPGLSFTGNLGNMTLRDGTRMNTRELSAATTYLPWNGTLYAGFTNTALEGQDPQNVYKTGAGFRIGEDTAFLTEARGGENAAGGSLGLDIGRIRLSADADYTNGVNGARDDMRGVFRVKFGGGNSVFTPRSGLSAFDNAPTAAMGKNEGKVDRGLTTIDWKNRIHGYDAQFDHMVSSLSFLNDVRISQTTLDQLQMFPNSLKGAEKKAVESITKVIRQGAKITKEDYSAWHSNAVITVNTKEKLDAFYFGSSPMASIYNVYHQDRTNLEIAIASGDKGKLETELQTARSHLAQMQKDIESIKIPELPAGTAELMSENNQVFPVVFVLRTAGMIPSFIQFIQQGKDPEIIQGYQDVFASANQSIQSASRQSPDFAQSLQRAPRNQFDQMFQGQLPAGFEAHRATLNALVAGANILKSDPQHLQRLKQSFYAKDIPFVGTDKVKTNLARSSEVQMTLMAFLQNPSPENIAKLSEDYYAQIKSSPYFVRTSFVKVQHSNDQVYQGANIEVAHYELRNKGMEQDKKNLLKGYYAWESTLNPESQGPGILGVAETDPDNIRNGAWVLGGVAGVGGAVALLTRSGGGGKSSPSSTPTSSPGVGITTCAVGSLAAGCNFNVTPNNPAYSVTWSTPVAHPLGAATAGNTLNLIDNTPWTLNDIPNQTKRITATVQNNALPPVSQGYLEWEIIVVNERVTSIVRTH